MRRYFVPLPQPTYSCSFNSIETVWNLAKNFYMKISLINDAQLANEYAFRELVLRSLRSADESVPNVLRVNNGFLREVLDPHYQEAII